MLPAEATVIESDPVVMLPLVSVSVALTVAELFSVNVPLDLLTVRPLNVSPPDFVIACVPVPVKLIVLPVFVNVPLFDQLPLTV